MDDFRLEYTEPDVQYTVNDPERDDTPLEPEYDYFEVDVEKTVVSTVFVRVPRGVKLKDLDYKVRDKILKEAASTLHPFEWEDNDDITAMGWKIIDEDEALMYDVYKYCE